MIKERFRKYLPVVVDLETESMADCKNMSILLYFYWKLSND